MHGTSFLTDRTSGVCKPHCMLTGTMHGTSFLTDQTSGVCKPHCWQELCMEPVSWQIRCCYSILSRSPCTCFPRSEDTPLALFFSLNLSRWASCEFWTNRMPFNHAWQGPLKRRGRIDAASCLSPSWHPRRRFKASHQATGFSLFMHEASLLLSITISSVRKITRILRKSFEAEYTYLYPRNYPIWYLSWPYPLLLQAVPSASVLIFSRVYSLVSYSCPEVVNESKLLGKGFRQPYYCLSWAQSWQLFAVMARKYTLGRLSIVNF
jgi:hypothetical protein